LANLQQILCRSGHRYQSEWLAGGATRALIAIDAWATEGPASPNAIFAPTNPACDLFDVRAYHAGQYKLSHCAPHRTGVRVRSHCRQSENRDRSGNQDFRAMMISLLWDVQLVWGGGARFVRSN
jgi:hypothetical protein